MFFYSNPRPMIRVFVVWLVLIPCGQEVFSNSPGIQEITRPCVGNDDIVACLRGLVHDFPEDTALREYVAYFLDREGDTSGALAEIDGALLIDPGDVGLHVFRAQLLRKLGDVDAAEAEGERIRELKRMRREALLTDPVDDIDIDELRVQAHLADVAGDSEAAGFLYQRYFEFEENPDPYNLSSYAKVLARLDREDAALEVLENAFETVGEEDHKTRAFLWKTSASVKRILGDEAGAEEDMREYDRCRGVGNQ